MAKKRAKRIKKISISKLTDEEAPDSEGGYWVNDLNNVGQELIGPYETKSDAIEGRRGLTYFWRECHEV